jgi:transcription termination factor Rho
VRGYLGNQARNRQGGGGGNKGGGGGGGRPNRGNDNRGNRGERMDRGNDRHDDLPIDDFDADDVGIISPSELAASRQAMNLTQLKLKPVSELVDIAQRMGLENLARSRKQDIIFSILKAHARSGEDI